MPVKAVLWTYSKKKDGTHPIKIKVSQGDQEKYFPKGRGLAYATMAEWNENTERVRPRHKTSDEVNTKIIEMLADYGLKLIRGDIFGASTSESVYDHFQAYIERSKVKDDPGNPRKLTTALNKFKEFQPDLKIANFNLSFLKRFETWMLSKKKKDGNPYHVNYIADCLIRLNIIATEMENEGVIPVHKNPFRKFNITTVPTEPGRLPVSDIEKMESLKLTDEGVKVARDMYLFSFYCYGIRWSDLCRLQRKNIQDGYLVYVMNKSRKKKIRARRIRLNQKALAILKRQKGKKHLFNARIKWDSTDLKKELESISARGSFYREKLRVICKRLGIAKTTFKETRNAVADIIIEKGLGARDAMELLGHAKLATTEIYLKKHYPEQETNKITANHRTKFFIC